MIRVIHTISVTLDKFCRLTSIMFLSLMLLLVLLQVVSRYIFQAAPVWTEEGARFCMVWGGLLGATVAFRADKDPRLFKPPTSGPRIWRTAAFWLQALCTIGYLLPILYFSFGFLVRNSYRITEALKIPMVLVTASVPVALIVILIHLIEKAAVFRVPPDVVRQTS